LQEAAQRDVLHNDTLAYDFSLVHLEQPRVNFAPVWNTRGDGVQLRGVLVERAVFYLVDAHDRHEVQIGVWEGRMQHRRNGDLRLISQLTTPEDVAEE